MEPASAPEPSSPRRETSKERQAEEELTAFQERYGKEWPKYTADIHLPHFQTLVAGAPDPNRLFERQDFELSWNGTTSKRWSRPLPQTTGLGLDADRGWRGRRPGPPPRKSRPPVSIARRAAGSRRPGTRARPFPGRAPLTGEAGQAATRARFHDACAARRASMADAPSAPLADATAQRIASEPRRGVGPKPNAGKAARAYLLRLVAVGCRDMDASAGTSSDAEQPLRPFVNERIHESSAEPPDFLQGSIRRR